MRPLDSVVDRQRERRRVRTERMADEKLNFMGLVGTASTAADPAERPALARLPQQRRTSTLELRGPVRLHVVPKVMPEGARFGMFTESLNGAGCAAGFDDRQDHDRH